MRTEGIILVLIAISMLGVAVVATETVQLDLAPMEVVPLSGIALIDLTVRINDKAGLPVAGAIIQLDLVGLFQRGNVDYTMITGVDGKATRRIVHGTYYINIIKSGYVNIEEDGPVVFSSPKPVTPWTLSYTLKAGGAPPPQNAETVETVVFWMVTPSKERIAQASAEIDGVKYTTTTSGKILVPEIAQGQHSIIFEGRYRDQGTLWDKTFNFEETVEITEFNNVFTVWVGQNLVIREAPPIDPNIIADQKMLILAVLAVGFIVFAIVFSGSGTEIIRQAFKR